MSGYEILTKLNPWQKSHWFLWDQDFSLVTLCPNADLFLKAANIIECFIHLYIHIQTNWDVFGQGTINRWLCCQVKMGCCSSTHTVGESMDKETHCSAGRQLPRRVFYRAMDFAVKAHNSLDPYKLYRSQQDAMNSNATQEQKRSPCWAD